MEQWGDLADIYLIRLLFGLTNQLLFFLKTYNIETAVKIKIKNEQLIGKAKQ